MEQVDIIGRGITRSSQEMEINVPAKVGNNPGFASFDVLGNAFYLIECAGEVQIKTDTSPYKTYRKSTGENFPGDQTFQRLEIRNYGSETKIKIWAGWGEYIDRRFELLEAPTKAMGWDDANQEVPANDHIDVVPVSGDGVIRRKAVIITNLDPNENLRLEDTNGQTFMTVFPRTSITLPVSDTVRINNDTGAAISCNIGQINYVEQSLITIAS